MYHIKMQLKLILTFCVGAHHFCLQYLIQDDGFTIFKLHMEKKDRVALNKFKRELVIFYIPSSLLSAINIVQ